MCAVNVCSVQPQRHRENECKCTCYSISCFFSHELIKADRIEREKRKNVNPIICLRCVCLHFCRWKYIARACAIPEKKWGKRQAIPRKFKSVELLQPSNECFGLFFLAAEWRRRRAFLFEWRQRNAFAINIEWSVSLCLHSSQKVRALGVGARVRAIRVQGQPQKRNANRLRSDTVA